MVIGYFDIKFGFDYILEVDVVELLEVEKIVICLYLNKIWVVI